MDLLLIEDHELVRKGIGFLMTSHKEHQIVGEFNNPIPAIEYLENTGSLPGVIIIDINTPEMNGLTGCKIIREKFPNIKLLILTSHKDHSYINESIELDVDGYVLKDAIAEELFKALSSLQNGKKYYSNEVINLALKTYEKQRNERKSSDEIKLTAREIELLQHISEGKTNKQIADVLCISQKTVETHRASMLKKMHAKNSIEMIKKAVKHKLIK